MADYSAIFGDGGFQGTAWNQTFFPAFFPQQQQKQVEEEKPFDYGAWRAEQDRLAEERRINNVLQMVKDFANQNGLGELWGAVESYVRQGFEGDALWVMIKNDPQYKAAYDRRFIGNVSRREKGLSELSPAKYVALEQAYKQAFLKHGLAGTFFDSADDFAQLIGNDVSAVEVDTRLQRASDYINYAGDENVKSQLREIYGLTDTEMQMYVLDPTRTLAFLESEGSRNISRANVGGAAMTGGVSLAKSLRDEIGDIFVSAGNENNFGRSLSGFQEVAGQQSNYKRLGALSAVEASSDDLVREQFGTSGADAAAEKKKRLASQERARFGGSSAISKTSLAQRRAR